MPTAESVTTYEAIGAGAAWRVVPRAGVTVNGPDAFTWLQGQVSQDLGDLAPGGSIETLVLSPQGKIDSYCRVTQLSDGEYLLDVLAGRGEALVERLRRFRLRVKAEVTPVEDLYSVEMRGPEVPYVEVKRALARAPVSWPPLVGEDILWRGAASELADVSDALEGVLGTPPGDDVAFEARRIEAGRPELGIELTERTIPQEAGELVARTVSFTKGCYTGQELVARLDARGSKVAKRLCGVVVRTAGSVPLPGSELTVGGAPAGTLTSLAYSPGFGGHVGLAYVPRRVEVPAKGTLGADGELDAEILQLPLVKA